MFARIIGVFKLETRTFEEIEHNADLTGQAFLLVVIVSLLTGVGGGFMAPGFFSGFLGALVSVVIGWVIWSLATWFVGTRLFKGSADLGEMLRVIGFAYTPQVLGIIPCVGGVIGAVWTLLAVFVAIRQGLDLDNSRAFFTALVGFIFYCVLMALINTMFGGITITFLG